MIVRLRTLCRLAAPSAALTLALAIGVGPLLAAPKPADKSAPEKEANSLDDELLKGLGGDPLEVKKPGEKTKPTEPAPAKPADSALDDELLKDLGGKSTAPSDAASDQEDSNDPFTKLNRQMRDVEQRLQEAKSDKETQDLQRKIAGELSELIKKIQRQQQQQKKSSGPPQQVAERDKVNQPDQQAGQQEGQGQQDQPARDSSDKLTKRDTKKVDMAEMQDVLKHIWGELPPRLRQQMMQSNVEKFLPKYESMIEEYFKALAEKQEP